MVWSAALAMGTMLSGAASAQSVEQFYKGKTITITVGSGVGGGYDVNTRLLAHHLSRHIPGNPNIVIQNMPGANGIKAMNHLYAIAPQDGTVLSAPTNNMPFEPMFSGPAAKFDVAKVNWLGSMSKQTNVCLAWKASGFASIDDVTKRKMRVSATGATGWRSFLPIIFNSVAGTQFEVINGYEAAGSMLAVERGEVDGICADYATVKANQSDWIKNGKIVILAQFGLSPLKGLDQVPLGLDRVKDPLDQKAVKLFLSQQEFGRPYALPPGVPADRVAALRAAFDATMVDPQFLAEAEKTRIDISPLTGAHMTQMFAEAYALPQPVIERTKVLLQRAGAFGAP